MGGVSPGDGETVPDVAVRVGGAVPPGVRLQGVIVRRNAVEGNVNQKLDAEKHNGVSSWEPKDVEDPKVLY